MLSNTLKLCLGTKILSSLHLRKVSSVVTSEKFEDVTTYNETPLDYTEDSKEWNDLKKMLETVSCACTEIPIVINGEEHKTKNVRYQVMPHNHKLKVAKYYLADGPLIEKAIHVATKAYFDWNSKSFSDRIAIWECAAHMMGTTFRADLVANIMLGQSKTIVQAELDTAELIDFTRMNTHFIKKIMSYEPLTDKPECVKNHVKFHGLEGFVATMSPFNFTSIAGNQAFTPALMGSCVVWKPSELAMLSNYRVFDIMRQAGVPDGVVNFVPANAEIFAKIATYNENLAAINFTGKQHHFNKFYKQVASHIRWYKNYPRMIGECSGKNFHFVHVSADVETVVAATIRSAFEYSGQKNAACSCLFAPASLWESTLKCALIEKTQKLKVGDVLDRKAFLSAVINDNSFLRSAKYIYDAKMNKKCEVIAGGDFSNVNGYFVEPTIVVVKDLTEPIFVDQIFGPVLAVYVYEDDKLQEIICHINRSPYGLTGSVFAKDEEFLKQAVNSFKLVAGNLNLNDKSTGSLCGQQPFGGARRSGTNDKPGGPHYILRWTNQQIIKETFVPMTEIYYPSMLDGEKTEKPEETCTD
ncbi:delta-1-pyrroline-5-carboxylate dehydrogenase, mitochondrial-like [Teleopsis dalmanni]|uniref:delta-1-pyrroline-5-carboxylate dehydrogenase, mitochondrial-like n=1 Tax=Teleopsis dalmanni TaxID=139649 RepID=UPI0018CEC92E|nr:delta-1-pyrroline-5-carboxylate dehydrogenase, mitochondrial-like [Teleopsis dalmanni]